MKLHNKGNAAFKEICFSGMYNQTMKPFQKIFRQKNVSKNNY